MNKQLAQQITSLTVELEASIQKFFANISKSPSHSFQQSKLESMQITMLLTKLEQLLDHSQLTFAMDHSKAHLLRVDAEKMNTPGAYSEQFSQVMKSEVVEETEKEKKNLSSISQNAYNTMEQLRKLNDQLFVEFLDDATAISM